MSIARLEDGCECGCGQKTPLAKSTNGPRGHVKGQPLRFIHGHNISRMPAVEQGAEFGYLTVLVETGRRNGHLYVRCLCVCGEETEKRAAHLLAGAVTSCGCKMGRDWPPWEERLEAGIAKGEPDECWEWTRARSAAENGYGVIYRHGRLEVVHRVVYEQAHGPIPEGYEIHHRCRNRGCVNLAHLEALTPAEHHELHAKEKRVAA